MDIPETIFIISILLRIKKSPIPYKWENHF